MDGALTTAIVAIAATVGAGLPTYVAGRQRAAARREDWLRQDKVAEQAARVAEKAEEKAAEVARQLAVSNALVAEQNLVTNGKLAQIHELVNSNLTAQMEEGHTALVQQLVLMREVVRLNEEAGREPDAAAVAAIVAIEGRIAELAAQLKDRAAATAIADAQAT